MRNDRRQFALAEIEELKALLGRLPESAVIERYSLQKRLDRAQNSFDSTSLYERSPELVRLTFRGAPVDGSRGIAADFAGKASEAFADAFAAVLAGSHRRLKYMGPIPDKSRYPLLITGTAVGSFGFEIELPPDRGLFDDAVGAEKAVEILKSLLRITAEGDDDEVADLVSEVHPRAIKKVSDFLEVLQQNSAWCGIEFKDDFFKYRDIEQLEISSRRLKDEIVYRGTEEFNGEFQGVLPQGRTFEFLLDDSSSIIRGKISRDIEDADTLNREWLHKRVTAKFDVVQVGKGRPRYTLNNLDDVG